MTKRNLFHSTLLALLLLVGASSCNQQPKEIDIIPMPRSVEYHRGAFTLSPETKFYSQLPTEGKEALAHCLEGTLLGSVPFADEPTGSNGISLTLCDSTVVPEAEGYRLEIGKRE